MTRVAAIDCGTNSIRLLIADVRASSLIDHHRTMRTVRLGEGIDATGEFSAGALARTFAACREYQGIIERSGADNVRFVATSASRDAGNRDAFISGVQGILGVTPEVISGDEEAELTFRGALAVHASAIGATEVMVVDIGGGSTEFVLGRVAESGSFVTAASSVDMGCVRMTERHLRHDPPSPPQIVEAIVDIDGHIATALARVAFAGDTALVGVAGSVTTVAALALGLAEYDADVLDGAVITAEQVSRVSGELLRMSASERVQLGVMHPGRADVIGGGALVLDRIVRATRAQQVFVSEHDILDGIALAMAPSGNPS